LSNGFFLSEDASILATWARYGREKLNDSLVRNAKLVSFQAMAKESGGTLPFLGKPPVKAIDKNISVDETGHIV